MIEHMCCKIYMMKSSIINFSLLVYIHWITNSYRLNIVCRYKSNIRLADRLVLSIVFITHRIDFQKYNKYNNKTI